MRSRRPVDDGERQKGAAQDTRRRRQRRRGRQPRAAAQPVVARGADGRQRRSTPSRAAADFGPDVVLLDLGLPDIDGYEVARRLRQSPVAQRALIIAVTGYGADRDRQRTRECRLRSPPHETDRRRCAGEAHRVARGGGLASPLRDRRVRLRRRIRPFLHPGHQLVCERLQHLDLASVERTRPRVEHAQRADDVTPLQCVTERRRRSVCRAPAGTDSRQSADRHSYPRPPAPPCPRPHGRRSTSRARPGARRRGPRGVRRRPSRAGSFRRSGTRARSELRTPPPSSARRGRNGPPTRTSVMPLACRASSRAASSSGTRAATVLAGAVSTSRSRRPPHPPTSLRRHRLPPPRPGAPAPHRRAGSTSPTTILSSGLRRRSRRQTKRA